VHNVPVSPTWVGHGLQENDFWLYSTDDFTRMVADTTAHGARSFVDALLQSKSLESSVIFNTYVLERLVTPGAPAADHTATTGNARQPLAAADPVLLAPALLPNWWPTKMTDGAVATGASSMRTSRDSDKHRLLPRYSIVAADVGTFKSCGLDLSHSSHRPEHSSWWSHRPQASEPALNCSCLGAKVYQLGQAGLRGDFIFPYKWNPVQAKSHLRLSSTTCLPGLAQHVPWCVSSLCDTPFRKERVVRDFGPSVLWGELEQDMERNGQGSIFRRQTMSDLHSLLKAKANLEASKSQMKVQ